MKKHVLTSVSLKKQIPVIAGTKNAELMKMINTATTLLITLAAGFQTPVYADTVCGQAGVINYSVWTPDPPASGTDCVQTRSVTDSYVRHVIRWMLGAPTAIPTA